MMEIIIGWVKKPTTPNIKTSYWKKRDLAWMTQATASSRTEISWLLIFLLSLSKCYENGPCPPHQVDVNAPLNSSHSSLKSVISVYWCFSNVWKLPLKVIQRQLVEDAPVKAVGFYQKINGSFSLTTLGSMVILCLPFSHKVIRVIVTRYMAATGRHFPIGDLDGL